MYWKTPLRICVTGAGGFIGSQLAKSLKSEGHCVIACDVKRNPYFDDHQICNTFLIVDLRSLDNCIQAVQDCDHVFHLAADTGGIDFSENNKSQMCFNNTIMSLNMLEACRKSGVKRFFYSSSSSVYRSNVSNDENGEKEASAWPALPRNTSGFQNLYIEQACKHYMNDFGLDVRIARIFSIYGPFCELHDERNKCLTAVCQKYLSCHKKTDVIDVYGDGLQRRSFTYIDDCIEGILKIMKSNESEPLNLGVAFENSITILEALQFFIEIENKDFLKPNFVDGPNKTQSCISDNTQIRSRIGWEPKIPFLQYGGFELHTWVHMAMCGVTDVKKRYK